VSAVAGLDTRLTDDHHESLRLWLRLLTCTHLIETQVRKALATQFKTTLPRFDLMAQLERAPHGLQMGEISRRMLVTGGNVTGIVDQLERSGLIARTEDPADRRAYLVKLTKDDPTAGDAHHFIPLAWVDRVDSKVHLKQSGAEAKARWKTH